MDIETNRESTIGDDSIREVKVTVSNERFSYLEAGPQALEPMYLKHVTFTFTSMSNADASLY